MEQQPKTTLQTRLEQLLEERGEKPAPLATRLGLSDSFIRDILRGKTQSPRAESLEALASALGTTSDYLLGRTDVKGSAVRTTTIVGRAGAATDGRLVYAEGNGGLGEVMLPEGTDSSSVAIEIEGYSMGLLADGALVFYSETHAAPTDDMLGQIVVVGLEDGSVLLKRLLRGSEPGLYDLESINGPMLRDQRVIWAAHIDSLVPPWRAARLKVDAGSVGL